MTAPVRPEGSQPSSASPAASDKGGQLVARPSSEAKSVSDHVESASKLVDGKDTEAAVLEAAIKQESEAESGQPDGQREHA